MQPLTAVLALELDESRHGRAFYQIPALRPLNEARHEVDTENRAG
jgi:hypothetical protein